MNLEAIQAMITGANKIIPVFEAIIGQITSLIGPLSADMEAAVTAVKKAVYNLSDAFSGLETAVKNAIHPPPPPAPPA